MSWFFLLLLALSVSVLIAAEWPRLVRRAGPLNRKQRQRAKRKEQWTVFSSNESDDFAASVERDLAQLPTVEERNPKR